MGVPRGARVLVRRSAGTGPARVCAVETVRHPGESVDGAARRRLREVGLGDLTPWAVDLSGSLAVLAVDAPELPAEDPGRDGVRLLDHDDVPLVLRRSPVTVAFRPLVTGDLPDVVRWTAAPHVARWWDRDAVDLDTARRRYGPRIAGEDRTRMWVLEVNGRSVGLAQDYRIGDHPEYAVLTAMPDAVGIDYLVGELAWVGGGTGTRLLWEYLRDVVRPHYPDAATVFAAPDHRNAVSLRVLDKLGFERGTWFDEPQSEGPPTTMVGCTLAVPRILGRWRG